MAITRDNGLCFNLYLNWKILNLGFDVKFGAIYNVFYG